MGYPLRSNIFVHNSYEQREFTKFPIQVIILFSPDDEKFVEALTNHFLELNDITGDNLVFFAILDPPKEWLELSHLKNWFPSYTPRSKFTLIETKILLRSILNIFNVTWDMLPVLVVSPNLWGGEYLICKTSSKFLCVQLNELTKLVQEYKKPDLFDIGNLLYDELGFACEYRTKEFYNFQGLKRIYEIIETTYFNDTYKFENILSYELPKIKEDIEYANKITRFETQILDKNLYVSNKILENVNNKLAVLSTVVSKIYDNLTSPKNISLLSDLDEETVIMIKSGFLVTDFIENLHRGTYNFRSIRLRDEFSKSRGKISSDFDLSTAIVPFFKALEREINLSLIQAARYSRTIKMPEYFAKYDPTLNDRNRKFKKALHIVETPRKGVNINAKDEKHDFTNHHRFIPFGDAFYVHESLENNPSENYSLILEEALNDKLPEEFLKLWMDVPLYRNPTTHTEVFRNFDKFIYYVQNILEPKNLRYLIKVKKHLLNLNKIVKN